MCVAALIGFSSVSVMADPVYMIAQIKVENQEKYFTEYGGAALPLLLEQDAKILAGGPAAKILEGEWEGNLTVVIEFPSQEKADAWYYNPKYQKAIKLRHAYASVSNLIFVPAFAMPKPAEE